MARNVTRAGMDVAPELVAFLEERVLPSLGFAPDQFWAGLSDLFARFTARNRALIARRLELQNSIDQWHKDHRGSAVPYADYERFLRDIGYVEPEPEAFEIHDADVDAEVRLAGPQLVVPATNRRFALNAVNARWGSLYETLRTSDVLFKPGHTGDDAVRAQIIRCFGHKFLDRAVPLKHGSWSAFAGQFVDIETPAQYLGVCGASHIFQNNGLKIELVIDRSSAMGRDDPAGIADVRLESALTAIVDFEDSVATVDAEDKVAAYETWLALMCGDLSEQASAEGASGRAITADQTICASQGGQIALRRRALLFVRVVGDLLTTTALRLNDGAEAPESILDTAIAALIGCYDLRAKGAHRNSLCGSIYIVKPKTHGPAEAAYTNDLFDAVEDFIGLPRHTLKVGLMDEERRTSVNLDACIGALKDRIVFVNTGFLDRTGDEIHTSMHAGPVASKGEMKTADWFRAYEDRNVRIALSRGFMGRAQIGKGMWAMPDRMADMVAEKVAHPRAGASTAWVPSPMAATLHAMHYHMVDVRTCQREIAREVVPPLSGLLIVPVSNPASVDRRAILHDVDDMVQSVLGYVVRWIDQGIGCSKVPNLADVGLMEDRATLRISCQMLANWLLHGIVGAEEIERSLRAMAVKVDLQNSAEANYQAMAGREAMSLAFQAARALVFEGAAQPNGYTEPLLFEFRRRAKRAMRVGSIT